GRSPTTDGRRKNAPAPSPRVQSGPEVPNIYQSPHPETRSVPTGSRPFLARRCPMAKRTIRDYLQGKDHRWRAGGPATHEEQNAVNKLKHDDPSTWPDTDKWKATGREGVCCALSTYWIIKGDDFWTWLGGYSTPGPQVGDIKDLMKKQSDEITHFGQGGKF